MKYEPLFASMNQLVHLAEKDKTKIINAFEYKKYKKKDFIVSEGAICTHVNFIVSGYVKKTVYTVEDKESVLLLYSKNRWVIVMESFIKQIPSDYNIQCITDVEVLQVSYTSLQRLYEESPAVNTFFRKLAENGLILTHNRIVKGREMSAKERYLEFVDQYPELSKNVPQYLIASYLGVTKEFLSRLKRQLQ